MTHRIAALTAILLLTLPLAATAQTQRVHVQAADLDLTTDAGRATLHDRIALAADKACSAYDDRMSEQARIKAHASCIETASTAATQQFNVLVAAAQTKKKLASLQP